MLVPEAAMHKDDASKAREDEVRRAGEIATVKAKAVAEPVREAPNGHLWPAVSLTDAGHSPADNVRHGVEWHVARAAHDR